MTPISGAQGTHRTGAHARRVRRLHVFRVLRQDGARLGHQDAGEQGLPQWAHKRSPRAGEPFFPAPPNHPFHIFCTCLSKSTFHRRLLADACKYPAYVNLPFCSDGITPHLGMPASIQPACVHARLPCSGGIFCTFVDTCGVPVHAACVLL